MHFHLQQKPARMNWFSENYFLGSYFGLSPGHMSYSFSLVTKASWLNQFSENYHLGSYFGLSSSHMNYLATVPLKYEMGNKTSISNLSGWQLKLSAPWCCGPPGELLPRQLAWNVKAYLLGKVRKIPIYHLLNFPRGIFPKSGKG